MLPKNHRLVKKNDFKRIAQKARPSHSRYLILKKLPAGENLTKIGFVVSAKISKKATVRNKIRRRASEILRLNLKRIKPGFLIMLVAKNTIINAEYAELEKDLLSLLFTTGILKTKHD